MNTKEINQWLSDEAARVSQEWFRLQAARPYARFYLYHQPGKLVVAEDNPGGFTLATGESIFRGQTTEQCTAWVYRQARQLPILTKEIHGI
jgi:hypothetical protein